MQNKRKDEFHSDAMLPLGVCAAAGGVFLALVCVLSYSPLSEDIAAISSLLLPLYLLALLLMMVSIRMM